MEIQKDKKQEITQHEKNIVFLFFIANDEEVNVLFHGKTMTKVILDSLLSKCVQFNLTDIYFDLVDRYPILSQSIVNDIEEDIKDIEVPYESKIRMNIWYESFCDKHNIK